MIRNFEELKAMLAACPVKRRIGVVAAQDEHTLDAVTRAAKDGMVFPVLIGDSEKIKELLKEFDFPVEMAEIIPSYDVTECAQIACRLVREGKLDCIMKGKTETGPLMKVLVNRENGIRKNDTMSMIGTMWSPNYHKIFAITDVGLLTYPTQAQKKAAIENAVDAFHKLGYDNPKVAILAAVEASDLEYYNESIIAKTASYAFRRAKHRKNKVTNLDKANVLASSALWRQKVIELSANYPGVILENRYVDTASMDVIREPGVFDVILTSNAYGDIIADELTQLSGTPSLFGSAELAPDGRGIYTPNQLHNPNEALIGQGTVCPVCIFSAVSMLLRYSLNESELARRVDRACHFMLNRHYATEELCLPGDTILTTDEFGDKLCEVLLEMAGD